MPTLAETFALIRYHAEPWGVFLRPPLSDVAATNAKAIFEGVFNQAFPPDYDRFLAFSNGMGTQRGVLFDGEEILTWNNEHWNRTPSCRNTPEGAVIESHPVPDPHSIEYFWIGSNGNMDMYSYHREKKQYRVTNLSFDYVYQSFAKLEDFLTYFSDPKIEFAAQTPAKLGTRRFNVTARDRHRTSRFTRRRPHAGFSEFNVSPAAAAVEL